AAHGARTEMHAAHPERVEDLVEPFGLRFDRIIAVDRLAALAETRQVDREVLLVGADAVDEDERLSAAALEISDREPGDVDGPGLEPTRRVLEGERRPGRRAGKDPIQYGDRSDDRDHYEN